ncbi:MAG: type II toxin-antitoxin system prevent-host-death family antitoxin [Rickettsiales bacterium]
MQVGMFEAKTQLSKLVAFAQDGEEVFITNRGIVVAKITAVSSWQPNKAKKLVDKMRKMTKKNPIGSFEEIMEWRKEGRK